MGDSPHFRVSDEPLSAPVHAVSPRCQLGEAHGLRHSQVKAKLVGLGWIERRGAAAQSL